MMEYKHTEDMGEISGFGGGYEATCQQMLHQGVSWLQDNIERRDLKASGLVNVFGILNAESDDAKALEAAVMEGHSDVTGAMHQTVMQRCFFIAKNGWDKYCQELREHEATAEDA
jgi:hypothetical protein